MIAALLKRAGVSNPDIAQALYAAAIGQQLLPISAQAKSKSTLDTLVDVILALR